MPAIGIDLGTTFSCVGVWYQGKVEIIANGMGYRTTPSYVAFTAQERLVGDPAKSQAATNPSNTVFDAKRLIGRRYNDPTLQDDLHRWPFKVVNQNGAPLIEVQDRGRTRRLSPVEVSAIVLAHMKDIAQTFLGTKVTDAVVTVPAYFNDAQRQATRDAGTVAGLTVLRVLNEPTAAALAYGQLMDTRTTRNVLIFDLGGGTLDVSLLTVREGLQFDVQSTNGNTHLGGRDFDNLLVQHLADVFRRKHGRDVTSNPRAMGRLRAAAEKAKHNLSFSTEVSIEVDVLVDGIDFHTRVSRARFEDLCASLFLETLEPVKRALEDAKLTKEAVHDVVLVGGSTRIPKIQSILQRFFDGKQLNLSINPDEAVAQGAAVQAAILVKDDSWVIRNLVLRDVIPLSLGIGLEDGGMKRIVERNTRIPCQRQGGTKTCVDNQASVLFEVYEGERPLVRDNNLLGSYVIDNIPPGPRGAVKFDTSFSIDADGILTVTSRERRTGVSQRITIGSDQHRLSRQEVQAMLREAEMYRAQDERQKRCLEGRRKLENLAYSMKQALREGEGEGLELALVRVGGGAEAEDGDEEAAGAARLVAMTSATAGPGVGRLSAEERVAAERAYREVLDWLETEQTQAEVDEYESRYQHLKVFWKTCKLETEETDRRQP